MTGSSIAYLYDGSPEGLLTAIFQAYARREVPEDVVREECAQLRLGQDVLEVETSLELALRVRRGIVRSCGKRVFDAVLAASLADDEDAGTVIYRFVRYALAKAREGGRASCAGCPNRSGCTTPCAHALGGGKPSVLSDLAAPAVEPFYRLNRAVFNERHRMLQFVRFQEMEGGVWFARCNPKHAVVPLVMDHFANRFNQSSFLVYDEVHRMAGVYEAPASAASGSSALSPEGEKLSFPPSDEGLAAAGGRTKGKGRGFAAAGGQTKDQGLEKASSEAAVAPGGDSGIALMDVAGQAALETDGFWASAGEAKCRLGGGWHIVRTDKLTPPPVAAGEKETQAAWRAFYRAAAIEPRYNPELRQSFLPQRFWKNITELQPEIPEA